jgi:hypothetical protein
LQVSLQEEIREVYKINKAYGLILSTAEKGVNRVFAEDLIIVLCETSGHSFLCGRHYSAATKSKASRSLPGGFSFMCLCTNFKKMNGDRSISVLALIKP